MAPPSVVRQKSLDIQSSNIVEAKPLECASLLAPLQQYRSVKQRRQQAAALHGALRAREPFANIIGFFMPFICKDPLDALH
jgi:hypothetical protein